MLVTRRAHTLVHLAPAVIGCLYAVWLTTAWGSNDRILERLNPLTLSLAFVAFGGGLYACWLAARPRYRVLLLVLSWFAALFVLTCLRSTAA